MKKVILLVVLFLNSIVFAQFSTDGLLVGYRFAEGEELKSVNHSADLTQTGNSLVSVNDRFGRKSALKLKKGLSLSLKSGQITGVIQGDSYGSDLQVSFTDTRIVNDGNWHHIAFRAYNNFPSTPLNSVRLGIVLFIDGTTAGAQLSHPVSTGTFGSYFVSEKFSIGDLSRGGLTSANKYQDEIDDLGVYNVLTSTSDINTYLINPTNLSIAYPINNLVAEHKLDNPNVFKDEQSTAINFIQTGNVSQISNRFGNTNKAISLNGAYLTRPSVAYGISDAITYSFWMKTTTNDNNRRVIFDHSNRNSISDLGATSFSGRQGISVVLRNGILQGWVSATTATGNDAIQGFSSTVNVADDAWHMMH